MSGMGRARDVAAANVKALVRSSSDVGRSRDAGRLLSDAVLAARVARLHYALPEAEGWTRKRRGKTTLYYDSSGRRISDPKQLSRLRSLAIPPAWTDVVISPRHDAHVQAVGLDQKGRKQYRYHPRFRAVRDMAKFRHMVDFGSTLPRLRRRLLADLSRPTLDRDKVLALVVELMQRTCIRVGNDCYAIENGCFGLTTLRDEHVRTRGATLQFRFRGKSGKSHAITLQDERLARAVQRCRDIPGTRLFQYRGADGEYHELRARDVNDYLRRVTGREFSAKDFRTWAGTVLAVKALSKQAPCANSTARRRAIKAALLSVSQHLGNTLSVCRKSYVHPEVLVQFDSGRFLQAFDAACARARRRRLRGLSRDEQVALSWLEALPKRPALLMLGAS